MITVTTTVVSRKTSPLHVKFVIHTVEIWVSLTFKKNFQLIFLVHGDDVWQHKFNELARGSEVWLGMTRENKNSEWEWIDGTKAQNIRWQPGQPNNYANDDNCSLLSNRHANDIPVRLFYR